MKKPTLLLIGLFLTTNAYCADVVYTDANSIDTDVSSFDKNLSSSDTTVQAALNTLDDITIPTNTNQLTNGAGFLTAESDPTFSSWASSYDHHANWDFAYGWGNHADAGYEAALGNPDVDGKVLSSTTAGVRSWITAGSDLTGYVKNDGTNLPFTADVTIDKTTPELKLLSNDDSDSYARITRAVRTLTVKNQVTTQPATGYAVASWNGTNRSIPVPSMSSFSDAQDHTFAAWIYLTSWNSNQSIIICTGQGASKGPALGFDSTGKITWWSSDSNWWTSTTSIPKNRWNLVAATFTASTDTITFYLNGVADGTATSNAFSAGTTGQCLGSRTDNNFWLPTGTLLDSCYIWNRVLSGAELLTVYNGGVGVYEDTAVAPFDSGLVEGWRFDENTGTTAATFATGGHNTGNFDAGLTWGTGMLPISATTSLEEVTLVSSTAGVSASEQGRLSLGHSIGRTTLNGKDILFSIGGTEVARLNTSGNMMFAVGKMIFPALDSVTGFGIADANGTRAFNFDTLNKRLGINNAAPVASLSLPASQTTAAYGIDFGGDVTLYRSAANVLKTDDALTITGALSGATTGAFSGVITSTVSTGTAPFTIASTTVCANLNAQRWNGITNAGSGTSGGIPYFSSTSAEASSGVLASTYLVSGGGVGAAPATGVASVVLGAGTAADQTLTFDSTAATDMAIKWDNANARGDINKGLNIGGTGTSTFAGDLTVVGNLQTTQLKTDTTTATDMTLTTGTAKTLVLATPVWDDLKISLGNISRPGGSDPAWVSYDVNGGGTSTYLLEFAKDKYGTFVVQLPHGYKTGTDIAVHAHWTPGPNGNEENGATVGWKIQYSWANIGSNFGTMSTADLSDACDGTDHKHQMTPDVTITGTSKDISSMLICNIIRTDTGTDDTWAGTAAGALPMLLEIDFHYQIDTIGSREQSAK